MKNLVILISGNGTNLQAIIEQCHHKKGICIKAVISNNEKAHGLVRAKQAGIDALLVSSQGSIDKDDYDQQLKIAIDQYSPDLLLLAGFMRILSPDFIGHYQGRILNIHPSLLPKHPGLHTHQKVLDAKDTEHGASVHFVTEELDRGPVILQARIPVFAHDNVNSLIQRVQQEEHRIYPMAVKWFCQNRLTLRNNRVLLDGNLLPLYTRRT